MSKDLNKVGVDASALLSRILMDEIRKEAHKTVLAENGVEVWEIMNLGQHISEYNKCMERAYFFSKSYLIINTRFELEKAFEHLTNWTKAKSRNIKQDHCE